MICPYLQENKSYVRGYSILLNMNTSRRLDKTRLNLNMSLKWACTLRSNAWILLEFAITGYNCIINDLILVILRHNTLLDYSFIQTKLNLTLAQIIVFFRLNIWIIYNFVTNRRTLFNVGQPNTWDKTSW